MTLSRTIAVAAAFVCASVYTQAQPKSVGAFFAPDRSGVSYQHYQHGNVFWNVDLAVDYAGCLLRKANAPGARIGFGYNFILKEFEQGKNRSRFYAGPGVSAGYVIEKEHEMGGFAGITANIGYEYDFSGTTTLSVSLVPTLGFHIHNTDTGMQMAFYRYGLLGSLSPQVGLRYCFGEENNVSKANEQKKEGKAPRVTFGIEWDYISTINSTYHHNFRATEGYRVNDKGSRMMYHINGFLLGHVGVNIGKHYNLSVYGGYGGIYKNYSVFPMSLRNTWLFGNSPSDSRWLCYLDTGVGLRPKEKSPALIGKAGCGYRLSLSRMTKVDFLLSYQLGYASVPFSDADGTVAETRINKNTNYLSALVFGIGITL